MCSWLRIPVENLRSIWEKINLDIEWQENSSTIICLAIVHCEEKMNAHNGNWIERKWKVDTRDEIIGKL